MPLSPRNKILITAVCLGIFASLMAYIFLTRQATPAHADVQVVVAKYGIPTGTIIDSGMVEMHSAPANADLPSPPAENYDAVVGRISKTYIPAGQPVTLAAISDNDRLSYAIPPFKRAVTVALDPVVGVGGFLKPGDRVDVVATFTAGPTALTKTVLQNVQLLAIGGETISGGGRQDPNKNDAAKAMATATLAVLPQDAEKLILAESQGRLRLMLRRADDISIARTGGISARRLVGFDTSEVVAPKHTARPAIKRSANYSSLLLTSAHHASGIKKPAPIPMVLKPLPGLSVPDESTDRIEIVRGTKVDEEIIGKQATVVGKEAGQ